MKMRSVCLILVVCILLPWCLAGCRTGEIPVSSIADDYLELSNISNCRITKIDFDAIEAIPTEPKPIDYSQISNEIFGFLKFDMIATNAPVKSGDAVLANCTIQNAKGEEVYQDGDFRFIVGYELYEPKVETLVLGKSVGDTISVSTGDLTQKAYTAFPDGMFTLEILSVDSYQESAASYERSPWDSNIPTFDELYCYLYDKEIGDQETMDFLTRRNDFYRAAIDCCKFEINEDDLTEYTCKTLSDYQRSAKENGVTRTDDDVLRELPSVEIITIFTGHAMEDLQAVLTVGALAEKYSICVSEESVIEYLDKNHLLDDASSRKYARFQFLVNAVFNYFCQSGTN